MSLTKSNQIKSFLQCPQCSNNEELSFLDTTIECCHCNSKFLITNGIPILLRKDNEVFEYDSYSIQLKSKIPSKFKKGFLRKTFLNPSVSLNYEKTLKIFAENLKVIEKAFILVVGSGSEKEWIETILKDYSNLNFIYCDIDINAIVDIFCDAHHLPFKNEIFHGVVITAVLEHVLYPEQVVQEIHRVLVNDGLIFSEIPFMQQVHEGAYDFTRYTLSGHRRLMNHFYEISSGLSAGPATALTWSIESLFICFAWNKQSQVFIKALIRLLFFWLKYIDYLLINNPAALDGASCTYFLGKKISSGRISDKTIIDNYTGAKFLKHI